MVEYDKRKYKCPWPGCGYEFEKDVGAKLPCVICPKCGNGLKADDTKEK